MFPGGTAHGLQHGWSGLQVWVTFPLPTCALVVPGGKMLFLMFSVFCFCFFVLFFLAFFFFLIHSGLNVIIIPFRLL